MFRLAFLLAAIVTGCTTTPSTASTPQPVVTSSGSTTIAPRAGSSTTTSDPSEGPAIEVVLSFAEPAIPSDSSTELDLSDDGSGLGTTSSAEPAVPTAVVPIDDETFVAVDAANDRFALVQGGDVSQLTDIAVTGNPGDGVLLEDESIVLVEDESPATLARVELDGSYRHQRVFSHENAADGIVIGPLVGLADSHIAAWIVSLDGAYDGLYELAIDGPEAVLPTPDATGFTWLESRVDLGFLDEDSLILRRGDDSKTVDFSSPDGDLLVSIDSVVPSGDDIWLVVRAASACDSCSGMFLLLVHNGLDVALLGRLDVETDTTFAFEVRSRLHLNSLGHLSVFDVTPTMLTVMQPCLGLESPNPTC